MPLVPVQDMMSYLYAQMFSLRLRAQYLSASPCSKGVPVPWGFGWTTLEKDQDNLLEATDAEVWGLDI